MIDFVFENRWLILLLFLLVDFFVVAFILWRQKGKKSFREDQDFYIRSHWIRIIDMSQGNMGQAVLDASKLLQYALKVKGHDGSVGDVLKKSGKSLFLDLDGVWMAQKLRNKLAHEFYEPKKPEGKAALRSFKMALNDLGAKL